ncbi:MAG: ATP-binding protein [Thermoplasmata archaeon]|nr:MAG: ATP-binding protein [Thermoplasmata archaeon]
MEELLHRYNPWWTGEYKSPGIIRERYINKLYKLKDARDVVLITGLRRAGKTTIMHQLIEVLLREIEANRIFYVSLDNMALRDYSILDIVEEYRKLQVLKHRDFVYLFLDEVHFKEDFDLQLKNLYDMGNVKIYASGSGSLEITMKSPYLTGRQRIVRINPLDFIEFIKFRITDLKPEDYHLYPKLAEEYVKIGGMPEYVKTGDLNYLQSLVDTIVYRDIAGRYSIRNFDNLMDILTLVAKSVGTPISYRKISRILGISKDEVRKIISLFTYTGLIHIVERMGKTSERILAPKKLYLGDTGFFAVLTDNINLGSQVENTVYLKLKEKGIVRYYYTSGYEVDFIVGDKAYESKYRDDIENLDNIRKLRGYERIVITKNLEKEDEMKYIPLW